jgi:hypothetical protein
LDCIKNKILWSVIFVKTLLSSCKKSKLKCHQFVSLQSKNTNNAKSEVRLKQQTADPWSVIHNRFFNAYFADKLNQHTKCIKKVKRGKLEVVFVMFWVKSGLYKLLHVTLSVTQVGKTTFVWLGKIMHWKNIFPFKVISPLTV